MARVEPQYASDYDDRTTVAVKSVLIEIGQVLGSYKGKFAVIGLVANFAVQRADGADLALRFYQLVAIDGDMPDGGGNRVQIAVASIPALLAMKGYAIANRLKQKDAYDIYHSIRNFPGGVDARVAATRPLLESETARTGYLHILVKFRHLDDFGPTSVRQFVDRPDVFGERTADQWQQDAFGQVDACLSALGLR